MELPDNILESKLHFFDRQLATEYGVYEATMILGLSASTIKRRLNSGVLKQVARGNLRENN